MALSHKHWAEARSTIKTLLSADCPTLRDDAVLRSRSLVPMSEGSMHLPAEIGDYTDFYSSEEHARNIGTMFRYSS